MAMNPHTDGCIFFLSNDNSENYYLFSNNNHIHTYHSYSNIIITVILYLKIGQALCTHCREHTHRAKMFSSHDVVHMSKCNKDTQRRCPNHAEQYIMFSQNTKQMLCATCFRETPADARLHCMDIETAWQQASKKMERAANSICELQASVHDGLLDLKSQLDDLKSSLEEEKHAINSFYQVCFIPNAHKYVRFCNRIYYICTIFTSFI